jgi:pyruvyltransferase
MKNEIPIHFFRRKSFWPKKKYNLGDELAPYLVSRLSGRGTARVQHYQENILFAVGSVLGLVQHQNQVVWGSGFIKSEEKISSMPQITAVRGPLTANILDVERNFPLGDPALLLPRIYNPPHKKHYDVGIIPHYIDRKSFQSRFLVDKEIDYTIIDIETNKIERFIDHVLRCRFIVSSSLHGLIISQSYGIPAIWVEFSNNVIGSGFKFDDYFESVKITPYPAISLKEGAVSLKYLHDMKNRRDVTLDFRRFDATPLLDAFEKAIRILDNNLLA